MSEGSGISNGAILALVVVGGGAMGFVAWQNGLFDPAPAEPAPQVIVTSPSTPDAAPQQDPEPASPALPAPETADPAPAAPETDAAPEAETASTEPPAPVTTPDAAGEAPLADTELSQTAPLTDELPEEEAEAAPAPAEDADLPDPAGDTPEDSDPAPANETGTTTEAAAAPAPVLAEDTTEDGAPSQEAPDETGSDEAAPEAAPEGAVASDETAPTPDADTPAETNEAESDSVQTGEAPVSPADDARQAPAALPETDASEGSGAAADVIPDVPAAQAEDAAGVAEDVAEAPEADEPGSEDVTAAGEDTPVDSGVTPEPDAADAEGDAAQTGSADATDEAPDEDTTGAEPAGEAVSDTEQVGEDKADRPADASETEKAAAPAPADSGAEDPVTPSGEATEGAEEDTGADASTVEPAAEGAEPEVETDPAASSADGSEVETDTADPVADGTDVGTGTAEPDADEADSGTGAGESAAGDSDAETDTVDTADSADAETGTTDTADTTDLESEAADPASDATDAGTNASDPTAGGSDAGTDAANPAVEGTDRGADAADPATDGGDTGADTENGQAATEPEAEGTPASTDTSENAAADPNAPRDIALASPDPSDAPAASTIVTPVTPETDLPNRKDAPQFDQVRFDPAGFTVIAGRAHPRVEVAALLDGEIKDITFTDGNGQFAMLLLIESSPVARVLSLRMFHEGMEVDSIQQVILAPTPAPRPDQIESGDVPAFAQAPDSPPAPAAPVVAAPGIANRDIGPLRADGTDLAGEVDGAPDTPETASAPAPQPRLGGTVDVAAPTEDGDTPAAPPADSLPSRGTTVLLTSDEGIRILQTPEPTNAPPQASSNLSLQTIAYDDSGEVAISGRGADESFVRIYLDNEPVSQLAVEPDGTWTAELEDIDTGVYTLRVDQLTADGTVVSRVESPFKREDRDVLARARELTGPITAITVQPGNTLWGISRERYGRGVLYVHVYEANRTLIRDPDLIYPGQVFDLPETVPDTVPDVLP